MMNTVASPWQDAFERFARSIRSRALIVAPFITAEPLRQFASFLDANSRPEIHILTNFDVDSLLQGSVDAMAIAEFCRTTPAASVRFGKAWKHRVRGAQQALKRNGLIEQDSQRRWRLTDR